MPPLQKRVIDVPLARGPNDKINPHLVDASTPLLMENCYQDRSGELRRRNGQELIAADKTPSGSISSVDGMFSSEGKLFVNSGGYLNMYSPVLQKWKTLGYCRRVDISASPFASSTDKMRRVNVDVSGDLMCYIWDTGTESGIVSSDASARTALVEKSTGIEVLNEELATVSGQAMHVDVATVSSTIFALCYSDTGSNTINLKLITSATTAPAVSTPATSAIIADAAATETFRCVSNTAGSFTVAYIVNATGDLCVKTFNTNGATINTYTYAAATAVAYLDAVWDSADSKCMVVFWDGLILKIVKLNSVMTASYAPQTIVTLNGAVHRMGSLAVTPWSGVTGRHFVDFTRHDEPGKDAVIYRYNINASGVASGGRVLAYGVTLVSRSFDYDGQNYVWAHRASPATGAEDAGMNYRGVGTLLCIHTNSGNVVARVFVDQHGGGDIDYGVAVPNADHTLMTRNVIDIGSGVFSAPFLRTERSALIPSYGASLDDLYDVSLTDVRIDLAAKGSPVVEVGDETMIGAGLLRVFDGDGVYASGLMMQHPNLKLNPNNGAGVLADGTYGVAAVYRWVDGRGREYYSAPTFETATLSGGANWDLLVEDVTANRVRAYYDSLSDKDRGVELLLFRTKADLSVYYFVIGYENDTSLFTVAASPDLGADADTTIDDRATLYTTGGVLAYVMPPTPHHIASDGETVALIPGDKRDTVWVSTPLVSGEGVKFTDDLVYDIPEGRDAEALAFMDGRLIVFKDRQIRYMLGEPPNALGQFGYTGSELITSDVGCVNWRSVVRVPSGLMFQSHKGFYLLGRDLQVSYVGSPAESYNDDTVLSAVVLRDENQVRICMSGGDVLVWDYEHNTWPRFTSLSPVASAVWNGDWVVAKSDGKIGRELSDEWEDYGGVSDITAKYRTGWLRLAAIQGYQRVKRILLLGQTGDDALTTTSLTVKTYINNDAVTAEETLMNAVDIGTTQNVPIEERITLGTQKMRSLMVEIEWKGKTKPAATFSVVSFECAAKKGAPRLSAANTR